jgi:hypothetical protein
LTRARNHLKIDLPQISLTFYWDADDAQIFGGSDGCWTDGSFSDSLSRPRRQLAAVARAAQ